MDQLCRTVLAVRKGEEVNHVVARLIALGVLADEAGHVAHLTGALHLARDGEKAVQLGNQLLVAAVELGQTLEVLLHVPCVLPCVAVGVLSAHVAGLRQREGAERSGPSALGILRAHEAGLRVEDVPVVFAALQEELVVCLLAQGLRELGGAVIVVSVLQRAGYALFVDDVVGQVAVLVQDGPVRLDVVFRQGALHRLIRLLHIEVAVALQVGVHDHRHAVVADHAVVVAAPEGPDGQESLLVVVAEGGLHEVVHDVRGEDGIEGMSGAVSVPE